MKHYESFGEFKHLEEFKIELDKVLETLDYDTLFNEIINETSDIAKGAASGAGWAGGAALLGLTGLILKAKGKSIESAADKVAGKIHKKNIPYAIAGAALIGALITFGKIRKKRKLVQELLKSEQDPKRREAFKKELIKLKIAELQQLKRYKKGEELARIKSELAYKKDKVNKKMDLVGAKNRNKLEDIKTEIREDK